MLDIATTVAALICTTTISLLPNILLFVFPNYAPDSPMLSIGQALAAGGLFGDVFLHTLPHAMMEGSHSSGSDDDHDHFESIGLAIISGFLVFFIFDVFVRAFDHHDHNHCDHYLSLVLRVQPLCAAALCFGGRSSSHHSRPGGHHHDCHDDYDHDHDVHYNCHNTQVIMVITTSTHLSSK